MPQQLLKSENFKIQIAIHMLDGEVRTLPMLSQSVVAWSDTDLSDEDSSDDDDDDVDGESVVDSDERDESDDDEDSTETEADDTESEAVGELVLKLPLSVENVGEYRTLRREVDEESIDKVRVTISYFEYDKEVFSHVYEAQSFPRLRMSMEGDTEQKQLDIHAFLDFEYHEWSYFV